MKELLAASKRKTLEPRIHGTPGQVHANKREIGAKQPYC